MTVITEEIKKFTNIASEWWNYNGPFKLLHEINPIRLEYIFQQVKTYYNFQNNSEIQKLKILDIGCGGGILSIPLSRLGADVKGIDAGIENIEAAIQKAKSENLNADFESIKIEEFADKDEKFDLVLCFEVLEHVEDPKKFISYIAKTVKEDGLIIVSTINKTLKSRLLAIGIAEYVLKMVPKRTHSYEKLITPYELKQYSMHNGLEILDLSGMSFDLKTRDWKISKNLDINYFATMKNG